MALILKNLKEIYGHAESSLSIVIEGDKIEAVGHWQEITGRYKAQDLDAMEITDCSDCIAVPGYVDSHTHLLFAGSRENELFMRAAGKSYLDILEAGGGIHNTVAAVKKASDEELLKKGLKYLDMALKLGITTIEIKSGYGLDFETEEKMLRVIAQMDALHPVDIVPTFLVHSVPRGADRARHLDAVEKEMIPAFRDKAEWFDIFLEKNVFDARESRRLIRAAMDHGYKIGIHSNQVHDMGGVMLAHEMGAAHVDHLEVLSDKDARLIMDNPNLYPVFLPTAEAYVFSSHVGQIHKLLDIPERIVFSSDFNPGSSPVLNPHQVMAAALLRYRISDPDLLIRGYTVNPARMLGLKSAGEILAGYRADILLIEMDSWRQIPYLGTLPHIKKIFKNGNNNY